MRLDTSYDVVPTNTVGTEKNDDASMTLDFEVGLELDLTRIFSSEHELAVHVLKSFGMSEVVDEFANYN
jgi:hypothetical protein